MEENASKALLIAGEVLIGVIILSLLIFIFGKIQDFTEEYYDNTDQQKLVAFNNQYFKYVTNNTANDATYIYAEDVVTIANQAIDWNVVAPKADETITVYIHDGSTVKTVKQESDFDGVEFLSKYKLTNNPQKPEYIFSCEVKTNNTTGRVNEVIITNKGLKTT